MKKLTTVILVCNLILLALYDVYAIVTGGLEATISHVTLSAATNYPIIPFAVGVVSGHLFWPQKGAQDGGA